MNRTFKALLPIGIVAAGSLGAWALFMSRSKPETRIPEPVVPLVRVQTVRLQDVDLTVTSQGAVNPRTESVLVPEVSGTVIEVSPSFISGGFFEEGDVLLRVDPYDYRQALVQARANVTQAELRVAQEMAEAAVALDEWEDLGDGDDAPSLTLREPQLADARAALAAAQAALEKAERDLERTAIRAPYAGRVREKHVDLGQFVNRGAAVATIYAVDFAEIRLPLPDSELAFIDLPLDYRGEVGQQRGPEVLLRANFAGQTHEWRGRIVRTEGEIDPMSRMVHTVARVKDPYARGDDPGRPPLAAGMFVEAEILGLTARGVAVLPRSALRSGSRILLVDEESRLRFREVSVLRATRTEIIVDGGLDDGDRVCLSSLVAVTDGMRVRTEDEQRTDADRGVS
jgi:RND family efflux transporter MFP subunit